MNLVRKFISLPNKDKSLFVKAISISLKTKFMVVILPFRWYSKYLCLSDENIYFESEYNEDLINKISAAVIRSSNYVPWSTKCLVNAITAKLLLHRNGISSILYLGVAKSEDQKLIAHAWLKCGDRFVIGEKTSQKFTVVSSFA